MEQQIQNSRILIETDSLLTVHAIKSKQRNYLEVGKVIEDCCQQLLYMTEATIRFVRKQANKIAHEIARIPYLANCHNIFTSPPICLLETILYNISK